MGARQRRNGRVQLGQGLQHGIFRFSHGVTIASRYYPEYFFQNQIRVWILGAMRLSGRKANPPVSSSKRSPTEARHPGSMNLDKMSIAEAMKLMLKEEAK